jgi:hypothetical protein
VLSATGCPAPEEPIELPQPLPASQPTPLADACPGGLEAAITGDSIPAAPGQVDSDVKMFSRKGKPMVLYPTADPWALHTATIVDGALTAPTTFAVKAPEIGDVGVAVADDQTTLATVLFDGAEGAQPGAQPAQHAGFVDISKPNGLLTPTVLDPSSFQTPAVATAADGTVGILFSRADNAAGLPDRLELARVKGSSSAGTRVVANGLSPDGFALVATPKGYVAFVAESEGAAPYSPAGLEAFWLNADGSVVDRQWIADGAITSPVAVWDGTGASIAFGWETDAGHELGFARLGPEAGPSALYTPATAIDASPDASALVPTSIASAGGLLYIGASFVPYSCVFCVRHVYAAHVVVTTADGTHATHLDLPSVVGEGRVPTVLSTPDGVIGVYGQETPDPRQPMALTPIALRCRQANETKARLTPDACSGYVTTTPVSDPSSDPSGNQSGNPANDKAGNDLRGRFDRVISIEKDLLITYADKGTHLARLDPNGHPEWDKSVAGDGFNPSIAVDHGRVLIAAADDAGLELTAVDATTGAAVYHQTLAGLRLGCLAVDDSGPLLIAGHQTASQTASKKGAATLTTHTLRLGEDGKVLADRQVALPAFVECAAVSRSDGFVVAYARDTSTTTDGVVTVSLDEQPVETALLDANGALVSSPTVIDPGYAQGVALERAGDRVVLATEDEDQSGVWTVDLDEEGKAVGRSTMADQVYYGVAFGLIIDPQTGVPAVLAHRDGQIDRMPLCGSPPP